VPGHSAPLSPITGESTYGRTSKPGRRRR
jgi:hypothetical protein